MFGYFCPGIRHRLPFCWIFKLGADLRLLPPEVILVFFFILLGYAAEKWRDVFNRIYSISLSAWHPFFSHSAIS
jgi:hypothetical protein